MDTPTAPYLKTLVECLNQLLADGYKENFTVIKGKLHSHATERSYPPEEVHIVNFYRFEGQNDPDDASIMYAIETSDGSKGTLVDGYGPSSDVDISQFIVNVDDIKKKTALK